MLRLKYGCPFMISSRIKLSHTPLTLYVTASGYQFAKKVTPFMTYGVMYAIHEGPKLEA